MDDEHIQRLIDEAGAKLVDLDELLWDIDPERLAHGALTGEWTIPIRWVTAEDLDGIG